MSAILLAQQVDNAPAILAGGFLLVWLVLGALALILWVWALIDAIQNPALSSTERIVWVVVIIFTNLIGAILYLLIGRGRGASGAMSHPVS
jgi:hypothetical protein